MTSVSITNFCHFVNGWRYIGHFSLKSVNKLLNLNTKIEILKTFFNYLVQKTIMDFYVIIIPNNFC